MEITEKDFVVITDDKDKKFYCKVTAVEPYRGVVCDDNFKDKHLARYIEFERDDVICNFGRAPKYGQSYGQTVEHIRYQYNDQDPFSSVRFYRKHNETEIKLVLKSLKRVADRLGESRIFPREKPIDVCIKDLKGPADGMYFHRKAKEGKPVVNDQIDLRIKDFGVLDYVITHELGHGVWFQLMDDKIRARWIKAFTKNISMLDDLEKKIEKMRGELIESGTLKAYFADLDEDDNEVLHHVVNHIKDNFNIKPMHINILIADGDDLTEVWPQEPIVIPKTQVLVTDYATKDPEELFCESFAFYFDPARQLPKSLNKLMESTITACRYGSNHKGVVHDD